MSQPILRPPQTKSPRRFGLFARRPERAAYALYGAAVAAARMPGFYTEWGVPDTLDGRFDLVGLHVYLLIERLNTPPTSAGAALAQAVFDAMFSDMDINLREMGVGDLSVGAKVRQMWEAFHGRASAYGAAFQDPAPQTAIAKALARNVWRGAAPDAAPGLLADYVLTQSRHLASQDMAALAAGAVGFLPPTLGAL
jgi:cytochrome b pre-mRNA-processing protein 3